MMIKKDVNEWLAQKNESFSFFGGEDFSNKEVIYAHLVVAAVILVCCVAEWLAW